MVWDIVDRDGLKVGIFPATASPQKFQVIEVNGSQYRVVAYSTRMVQREGRGLVGDWLVTVEKL